MGRRRVVEESSNEVEKSDTGPGDPGAESTGEAERPAPTTGTRRRVAAEDVARQNGEPPYERPASMKDIGMILAGETVTVTWGEESFTPTAFHSFRVGPFSATAKVMPGETIGAAMERTMRDLRSWAETERDRKRAAYLKLISDTKR